ncbi:MFS transporter [Bosea sp. (in: a-proteobacteria)]|uniref:MFS transporter n=1 Tax=Bosea sp. (in: a-proteobacteria) TaxID=1871050 RepID=UPI0026166BDB|nr:MFS transporter [Bosea sp. (in: a-proteobacteria)]MCO5092947.1 MFS transporter [Bosea sp. (in: a-proteobacteria)]
MSEPAEPRTSSVAALGAIVSGALILQIAATIVNTVVPLKMALEQMPPLLIGLVGSAYSVGFLAGCFVVPAFIRRVGHIRAFAVFSALQAVFTLSFALTPLDLWGAARLGMGFAGAGHAICIETWISGQAKPGQRGRLFGFYQILNRLALIGSQIGVGYVALQSHDIFLLASAAFSIALIPVGMTHAKGPESGKVISVRLNTMWQYAPASVIGCLYTGLMGATLTNIVPAYGILIGLDQAWAILLTAGIQIGALLLQWPLGLLADRVESRKIMLGAAISVLLCSMALGTVIWLALPYARFWLFGLFALIGAGAMPIYAVAVAHAYFRLGPERALGLSAQLLFLWATGSAIGPLVSTTFMQVIGPQGLLVYFGLLSAATGAYLAFRLRRNPPSAHPFGERKPMMPTIPDVTPSGRRSHTEGH